MSKAGSSPRPACGSGPSSRPSPRRRGEGEEAAPRNASRFSEARLHAVSSKNMYSEHGFDARIGPEAGQVCQSLMVVWYCRPGSAEAQAAQAIFSHNARAFTDFAILPGLVRQVRSQSPSASTAFRNSSVTRTVLFEFWPDTVR